MFGRDDPPRESEQMSGTGLYDSRSSSPSATPLYPRHTQTYTGQTAGRERERERERESGSVRAEMIPPKRERDR